MVPTGSAFPESRLHTEYSLRTVREALECAADAASVCPDNWRVQLVLAELLVNAVEHGNLEIGYARKLELLGLDRLDAEIERRLALPEYASRRVRLIREREPDGWCFDVADDGAGFEWQAWRSPVTVRNPAANGRGIRLLQQLGFHDVQYMGCGNRVRLRVEDVR